jgi:hypothetical protein
MADMPENQNFHFAARYSLDRHAQLEKRLERAGNLEVGGIS